MGLKRIKLYCHLVKQTAAIFKTGSSFASNLIKVVKKNKSWQIKE